MSSSSSSESQDFSQLSASVPKRAPKPAAKKKPQPKPASKRAEKQAPGVKKPTSVRSRKVQHTPDNCSMQALFGKTLEAIVQAQKKEDKSASKFSTHLTKVWKEYTHVDGSTTKLQDLSKGKKVKFGAICNYLADTCTRDEKQIIVNFAMNLLTPANRNWARKLRIKVNGYGKKTFVEYEDCLPSVDDMYASVEEELYSKPAQPKNRAGKSPAAKSPAVMASLQQRASSANVIDLSQNLDSSDEEQIN